MQTPPPGRLVVADDFPSGRWRARWIWSRPAPSSLGANAEPEMDRDAARSWSLFRRTFDLATVPTRVVARTTADSRYLLAVNGVEVGRGPVRGHPQRLHYDLYDLAPYLRTGTNVVTVLGRHYGHATPWWMPATPTFGLGAGSLLFEAALGDPSADQTPWIVSDDTWRALEPGAWQELDGAGIGAMPPEALDARLVPAGWQEPAFDDNDWPRATLLATNYVGYGGDPRPPTHPYGPLLPRPIPQLTGATRKALVHASGTCTPTSPDPAADPITQYATDEASCTLAPPAGGAETWTIDAPSGGSTLVVFDFGEQVSGHVVLELDAPDGTRIDAKAAEAIDEHHHLQSLQQHSGFRYICRGAADSFASFDTIGLRYLGLSIRHTGPVTIASVAVHERNFPRATVTSVEVSAAAEPSVPSFTCSDPLLEDIWRIGRRTVDLCSQDAYLDCPSREQRGWTGDSVVHQLVDLTSNTDWSLARWNVELGGAPRPDGMLPMAAGGDFQYLDNTMIPDWALHWVHALANVWSYTGDREFVLEHLPIAERVLRWFVPFQDRDGLLDDVTGWIIIDWAAVVTTGKSAALNALWARGLWDFARMCEALGDGARQEWAHATWTRVHRGFEQFWDDERGVYVDNISDGVAGRTVSQHSNAAAIVAGLVDDPARARAIIATITDADRLEPAAWLMPGRPATLDGAGDMYAGFGYLVTGLPDPWWDVESRIVAAQPFFRYVVHDAVAHAGLAERIPALCRDWQVLMDRSATTWTEVWYGGSHCHGWCSTPTRDLVQHTLGVTPAEPGFTRARIEPHLGDLDWAAGAVPTPAGLLRLTVRADTIEVDSPIPFDLHLGGEPVACPAGVGTWARR